MVQSGCFYDKENKCWFGPKRHEIFNENMSAGELAFFSMRSKNPENIMQISNSEGTALNYADALMTAIRIAQHLAAFELNSEDVISIFAPNTTFIMPVALAALFNCTPFQPINTVMETDVLKQILAKSRPKVIFCDGLHYEKVKKASLDFGPLIYTLCNHLDDVPQIGELLKPTKTEHDYKPRPLTKGPNQTMVIMLSSGTTGISKAVCMSNRHLTDLPNVQKHDINFATCSIDWLSGLYSLMTNLLIGGIKIITTEPLTAGYILNIISKYKITKLATNPSILLDITMHENCIQENVKTIREVQIGGSHCAEKNLKKFRSLFSNAELYFVYGSTEVGRLSYNNRNYKLKSTGKISPNMKLKIINQKTGKRLGPNEVGEICAQRINDTWPGYYKNPEATQKTRDDEGFIHTGDMGYIDEENYLHLIDRCSDFMKNRGYKWSPREIEVVINEMPDVMDICVFDIFHEINLHEPAAAVVEKPGSSLTAEKVIKFVQQRIEVPYKHLSAGAFVLDKLPRNKNGKLLRNQIREICLAKKLSTDDSVER